MRTQASSGSPLARLSSRPFPALFAVVLGALAALPLLLRGASCGHDFDFHLQSWLAVHEAWRGGLLNPHWVAPANYGAGEPRFVFYPPLTWLMGGLLGFMLPWIWVPAAFTALWFAGAAASMYRLAREVCAPVPALLASTLYALGPYLLFTGYERTAYGELAAAVWMPLLLLQLLQPQFSPIRVALLIAALWYTNAPAAVMGCYLVVLAALWHTGVALRQGRALLSSRDLQPAITRYAAFSSLVRGGAALLLGGALAADYLLPAWYEERFVSIDRAVSPGMRIEDSFPFGHTGEPFHDQVLATASWIVIWVAVTGIIAYVLQASRRLAHAPAVPDGAPSVAPWQSRAIPSFLPFALGVCLLLQLPPTRLLWHALPELGFLQFPWRLLLPASAAGALLVAAALPVRARRGRAAVLGLTGVYAVCAVAWASHTRYQPCDDEDNVSAQLQLLEGNSGFEGTDEYAAAGADNGEIQQGLPRVRLLSAPDADEGDDSREGSANPPWQTPAKGLVDGQVRIDRWTTDALSVRMYAPHALVAVLRLERFPAWQVVLNGSPCARACLPREDGLLTIQLPPGRWSTISARYTTTRDVWVGRAASLAAFLLLLLFAHGRQRLANGRWLPAGSAIMGRK